MDLCIACQTSLQCTSVFSSFALKLENEATLPLKDIAPRSSQMSPEDPHKPIRIYIGGLILGVNTWYMFFCFFKLFAVVGNDMHIVCMIFSLTGVYLTGKTTCRCAPFIIKGPEWHHQVAVAPCSCCPIACWWNASPQFPGHVGSPLYRRASKTPSKVQVIPHGLELVTNAILEQF